MWIDVLNKLPNDDEWVFIATKETGACKAGSFYGMKRGIVWYDAGGNPAPTDGITHWMRLPAPPTAEQSGTPAEQQATAPCQNNGVSRNHFSIKAVTVELDYRQKRQPFVKRCTKFAPPEIYRWRQRQRPSWAQEKAEEMKGTVIIDVDGTLTKVGARVECLAKTPPDWDSFYNRCDEDKPVPEIIKMANVLCQHYRTVLCTGRRESCREATELWFRLNGLMSFDTMLMRPDGDHRHDTVLKPELLERAGIKPEEIAFVLEDRNSMVQKWREMGIVCLQVADGDF